MELFQASKNSRHSEQSEDADAAKKFRRAKGCQQKFNLLAQHINDRDVGATNENDMKQSRAAYPQSNTLRSSLRRQIHNIS